jgi:Pyruvate/2-oxoacid:ferredoxin oxidoreductase delta subunit
MDSKKEVKSLSDLPIMPSTIGTMAWNQTGDWRYLTPVVADKLAPCAQNCPAGVPVTDLVNALRNERVQSGSTMLLAHNPLPGLTSRLCYHPCQSKCVRRKIDRAISIQQIERFFADTGMNVTVEKNSKTDKKVAVIGSGPLGLSCAFYLGCWGCQVVVVDPRDHAGGALVDLSPEKVDPQLLVDEIRRLVNLADIKLETGFAVDFDKPGEAVSEADLVILDSTGLPEDFSAPGGVVPLSPFDDETTDSRIIAAKLPPNLKPFKAPMIAHYVGAGRLMARKAFDGLVMSSEQPGIAASNRHVSRKMVNVEDIKIERFSSPDTAGRENAKPGIWDLERARHEAENCLSCGTCNLCLQCVSSCPDATIRLDEDETAVTVDLDHCKGCGICAYECPRGVITMETVST